MPGRRRRSTIKRAMKTRRAEKSAEFLENAWVAMEKGNVRAAVSLYYHAATVYGAKFVAVIKDLNAAKRRGLLPADFPMPRNAKELKGLLERL